MQTTAAPAPAISWTPGLLFRCFCIACNALTAQGIFTFPIIGPSLARNLHLTQSQLSAIVLAGMAGQYPLASLVGELVDRVGTWATSLCAFCLFFIGYGVFAWTIDQHVTPDEPLSDKAFHLLVACFFLLGLGAVNSYFSAVFSAAKQFPRHIGFATGAALALFGLSPLALSLPSAWFLDKTGIVDARNYAIFLGIVSCSVHVMSTFGLRGVPRHENLADETRAVPSNEDSEDEQDPLLPKSPEAVQPEGQGWLTLLSDGNFWWLWTAILLSTGSAEMVMGNIGTIITALPGSPATNHISGHSASTQVRIISFCNTIVRFIVGSLIDILSPSPYATHRRKFTVSRIGFVFAACMLLAVVYGYVGLFLRFQTQVWILSAGAGLAYGTIWAVVPSVVKIAWGEPNVGRNFGIISYSPFFGTPIFSYIFAANVEQAGGKDCHGPSCWNWTFRLSSGIALLTGLALLPLWRKWRNKV